MSIWRLVFFGLLLMLTLRFWRNGLLQTVLLRFERAAIARETVARRVAADYRPADGDPENAP